jgi:tetratricopeptide (TPR) repeat protein
VQSDDESTDINIPIARPKEGERSPDSLTRPNLGAPKRPPPLEEALTFDDQTEVSDVERPRPPPITPDNEGSLELIEFSVPLGPNDTIIPTRPRGNVSAYDALISRTREEQQRESSVPPPVSIGAFPDPNQFMVGDPEDAATQQRAPKPSPVTASSNKKTVRLDVNVAALDLEATQSLSGEDLEVLEQHAEAHEEARADAQPPIRTSDSFTGTTGITGVMPQRQGPQSTTGQLLIGGPPEPAHEIPTEAHVRAPVRPSDPPPDDGNATLVPSKAHYQRLLAESRESAALGAEPEEAPTHQGSIASHEEYDDPDERTVARRSNVDPSELLAREALQPPFSRTTELHPAHRAPAAGRPADSDTGPVEADANVSDANDSDNDVSDDAIPTDAIDLDGLDVDDAEVELDDLGTGDVIASHPASPAHGLERGSRPGELAAAAHAQPVASGTARGRSIPPTPIRHPTYKPPALAEGGADAVVPAFQIEPDLEERGFIKTESWEALIELYLTRIQKAPSWPAKAKLFARIASVFEWKLHDPEQALDALLEAFDLSPVDEEVGRGLDRVAGALGRFQDIIERARVKLAGPVPEGRLALVAHVARWYDVGLGRPDLAAPYLEQIEKIDRNHPLLLRRNATQAKQQGDTRGERDALERMLDAASRADEKVEILRKLAEISGTAPAEALRYYERAYSLSPKDPQVLLAIEKNGEKQEKFGQVEWALRAQIAAAATNEARIGHHMRAAAFYERRMLKRDLAARDLEMVLAMDPRNAEALAGLERCYRALQSWPDLARTLERTADVAPEPHTRIARLMLAAEVHEIKSQDAKGALRCLKQVLGVDTANKKAIELAARLSQKVKDFGDVTKYRTRLAELEPTPRGKSQQYLQLAEALLGPGGDELGSQRFYELAVDTDPKNAGAWEALTRLARASQDPRRLARVLEKRAENTTTPRVRAQVFVELAETLRTIGDAAGTTKAYEAAVAADRTNEDAAAYTLDKFVKEARWKEAAPLVELLVNAAVRDQETTQLIGRLRLATRVAAAQGDVPRAVGAAVQAYDARPDDPGSRGDLLDLCIQLKATPEKLTRAVAAVERITMRVTELDPGELSKLGQVLFILGQTEEAISVCARALDADPKNRAATAILADAYAKKGDWAGASDCKVSLARSATDAEERFKRLCEAGDIWATKAKDSMMAREIWEEALTLKPRDRWLLHALMRLYGDLEAWDRLSATLFAIAETSDSAAARGKSLFLCAQVFAEKIGDLEKASEVYDQVLETDRKRLDAFEQIVRIHTYQRDWHSLERSYRKMLARMRDSGDPNLLFELWKQLGIIYRDRLGEPDNAREALSQADKLRPTDGEIRKMMTELDVVTDNIDNAIARCRRKIEDDPHEAELYAEIYELFLRKHQFDKAWCALNVLAQFRDLAGQEAQFYADYPPFHPANIPGQLTEAAWVSHILHPSLDPVMTRIFALMTPIVARARAQTPGAQEMTRQSVQLGMQHTHIAQDLYGAFRDACEILSLHPPELLAAQGTSASPPFVPATIPYGALYVNAAAIEVQQESMQYLVGKRLAEQRAELAAKAFFPTVTELRSLLAAAVRIANNGAAKDPASQGFDNQLRSVITWEDVERLRRLVGEATQSGSLFDVKRWAQVADLSSSRAGLLLCGDVTQARRAIAREAQAPTDLSPREKLGELYIFATSEQHADLRGAIGVAVGSE